MTEKKIVELEEKIAFIQNMLDDLNMVVFRQGEIIEKLNTQVSETNEKLISQNESQSDQNQTNDEKPPHF